MRNKKIKAYITGICGFAGSWLAEELIAHGYSVRGAALPDEPDMNIAHIRPKIRIDRFDITDGEACKKAVGRFKPDYLFHLAAMASVGQSFSAGVMTFQVNVNGSQNIFEAVRGKKWLKKLLFVSSSDVYGPVKSAQLPIRPGQLPNPVSPYAQSKVAAEYLARIYREQYDIPICVVRPFNHTGPRQSPQFVIPSFCQKIAEAEQMKGKAIITVGNLNAKRDISDVRDIVRGYRLIAEKGMTDRIYHLCSGKAYRIGDLLKKLIEFTDKPIKTQRDKYLFRKVDIPVLRGSYRMTKQETGWKPQIAIEKTLRDSLDYWRA